MVPGETSTAAAPVAQMPVPAQSPRSRWHHALPTAKFLMRTEVHTFAFSVAANAILSFFPFLVLLMTVVRRIFHSKAMADVIVQLLRDYLPAGQDFVIRNLNYAVSAHRGVQIFSLFMLLVTSSGVFLPLEVALNQVWGFTKNRSYLGNQLISLGLACAGGVLSLLSVALAVGNRQLLRTFFFGADNVVVRVIELMVMRSLAIVASITIFFLIYWLLPNGKISAKRVMPAAVVTGLVWEVAKYLYMFALPWLNFADVYGPFSVAVTLMFWAFFSGLLLIGGAYLSAQNHASAG